MPHLHSTFVQGYAEARKLENSGRANQHITPLNLHIGRNTFLTLIHFSAKESSTAVYFTSNTETRTSL